MTIGIRRLMLGIAATNCYIIGDEDTIEAVMIDPVDQARLPQKTAHDAGWTIKLILATHGHFDHVLASKELKELTGAPFYIHQNDVPFLRSLPQMGVPFTGQPFPEAAVPDRLLNDFPETITLGAIKLEKLFPRSRQLLHAGTAHRL
jgi:glyoxylase-like metal-dependent hydrolase (beta-lactamase superfamily II)